MAGRGPAPSGNARRRNKQPPGVKIDSPTPGDEVELHGPELGPRPGYVVVVDRTTKESRRVKLKWLATTREWWELWRAAPQARLLSSTDWAELRTTALLYDDMWRGETKNAAEVRLRVAKFGATLEDRQRLRMTFATTPRAATSSVAAPPAPTDEVNRARERRERIAQRAAGGDA